MNPPKELPEGVGRFARQHPELWEAYNALGEATAQAGPLDEKTQRLVKLALAIGAGRIGAVHSHVRRALKDGITPQELEHVAILAIPTLGWSAGFAALTWIDDETPEDERSEEVISI
jgi:alkylhydroperoxidase/carboxymuconolactone decarboxylase family protein YurZ